MYLVPRGLLICEFANTHKKFGLKFCICEFCFRGTKYRDASTANNKAYLYALKKMCSGQDKLVLSPSKPKIILKMKLNTPVTNL